MYVHAHTYIHTLCVELNYFMRQSTSTLGQPTSSMRGHLRSSTSGSTVYQPHTRMRLSSGCHWMEPDERDGG